MLVKDLIEELQKYPPHYKLEIASYFGGNSQLFEYEILEINMGDPSSYVVQDRVNLIIKMDQDIRDSLDFEDSVS